MAPDGRDVCLIDLTQPLGEGAASKLPTLGSGNAFIPFLWSSDGRYLAGHPIGSGKLEQEGIILYSVEGRTFTQISNVGVSPQWLSDGRRLLVLRTSGRVSDLSGGSIALLDRVTGETWAAASTAIAAMGWRNVTLSSDNRTLVYGETTRQGDIWLIMLDR